MPNDESQKTKVITFGNILSFILGAFFSSLLDGIVESLRETYGNVLYLNSVLVIVVVLIIFIIPIYIIWDLIGSDQKSSKQLNGKSRSGNLQTDDEQPKVGTPNKEESSDESKSGFKKYLKIKYLLPGILWIATVIFVANILFRGDLIVTPQDISPTETVSVENQETQITDEIPEDKTSTLPPTSTSSPSPSTTPTPTPTRTSTPTITPTPTKGLESGCIRGEMWNVYLPNWVSKKTVDPDGCADFDLLISGVDSGFRISDPTSKTGVWGITRPINSESFTINFNIILNKFAVNEFDQKSRIFFGFIEPSQTLIDYNPMIFTLEKIGIYYKLSLLYEKEKIFYFKILDGLLAKASLDEDEQLIEEMYKVEVSIEVNEKSQFRYIINYDGDQEISEFYDYDESYNLFIIGYDFVDSTTVDIEILDFTIIE